ncbi:hypothetical protein VAPA_1c44240 [Variovorax paradoxus B4]|uniref:Response regulatory domain-containing protein n=2 Tax=Variovorax paradoxus TaxID=34073 RepID=A0A0H2LVK0_VARPD|nr:hypothetical protein [Variovorax paradoxus]AGU51497.1 hypothetical protein VAPA_1c44240 [Variovorax paradoxus B4]KLN53746.1 hypothetical protein VPARA_50770 [Variovorax paradoxus]
MTSVYKLSQNRIALVDSDALQRMCTGSSLKAIGIDHASFEHLHGLINAVREGRRFDAILLGLHADATPDVALISDVWSALGQRVRVFFMAHSTELRHAREALSRSAVGGLRSEVILSPASDAELRAVFHGEGFHA